MYYEYSIMYMYAVTITINEHFNDPRDLNNIYPHNVNKLAYYDKYIRNKFNFYIRR